MLGRFSYSGQISSRTLPNPTIFLSTFALHFTVQTCFQRLLQPISSKTIRSVLDKFSIPIRSILRPFSKDKKSSVLQSNSDSKRCARSAESTGQSQKFEFYNLVQFGLKIDLFQGPNHSPNLFLFQDVSYLVNESILHVLLLQFGNTNTALFRAI